MQIPVKPRKPVVTHLAIIGVLSLVACADASKQTRRPPEQIEVSETLPEQLLGRFRPYSKSYWDFGDLTIRSDALSWGQCKDVKYRVFRRMNNIHYIEQEDSHPCKFSAQSTYLVIVQSADGIEVSICPTRDEFDKGTQAKCSWGVVYKQR